MVKPGFIDTRMQRQGGPERLAEALKSRPMTPPSAVADAIASFAVRHEALPFVTGMVAKIA
jgi:NAD(P)-dependent dehydrogenase (short-subunit alcohol dehydrogenase family)